MKRRMLLLALLFLAPATVQADDQGWPRNHVVGGYTVGVYQPQVEEWAGYRTLKFRLAVAVAATGAKDPAYGVVVGHAPTHVNWQDRTVLVTKPVYDEVRFPAAAATDAAAYVAAAQKALPAAASYEVSLDRLLANVQRTKDAQRPADVNLDPPPIFYSLAPAILVVFTGDPVFQPVQGTGLKFATNTNWPVFLDAAGSGAYYLLSGDSWWQAPDPVKGPWTAAGSLPAGLSSLPEGDDWDAVREHVPGSPAGAIVNVVVATQPAELIVTSDAPSMVAIAGTTLLYISNTDSDVFFDFGDSTYYFLAAGRWFSAKTIEGPWRAATKSLPATFAKIPVDSPKADVLASVPGTPQAQEAVLQASIPHTATVSLQGTTVSPPFDGAADFAPIMGSNGVSVATNTSYAVFQVESTYLCCHDGIWFQAAAPTGPWTVCTNVPEAIYSIPASSPYHNVTYVYAYDATADDVVYGYTGGYYGEYVSGGLLMFGAGLWLGSALAWGPYSAWRYPASWYSYGAAARYSYYAGGFIRGAGYYGPYGGAGYGARYNPATGTYARGAAAYGPRGAVGVAQAYNPWTGRGGAAAEARTPYGSWGRSVVSDGDNWARFGHTSSPWGSTAGFRTSTGAAGALHSGPMGTSYLAHANGNVFAGRDGNVYRASAPSGWDRHTSSGWQNPGWGALSPQHLASHPSSWASDGWGGGDVHRQLSADSWGRSWGSFRDSGRQSEWGGGGGWRGGGGGFGGGGWGGGGFGGGGRRGGGRRR